MKRAKYIKCSLFKGRKKSWKKNADCVNITYQYHSTVIKTLKNIMDRATMVFSSLRAKVNAIFQRTDWLVSGDFTLANL